MLKSTHCVELPHANIRIEINSPYFLSFFPFWPTAQKIVFPVAKYILVNHLSVINKRI